MTHDSISGIHLTDKQIPSVLIVDDAPNWLNLHMAFYKRMGFKVRTAMSYGEASGLLRHESFNLAIIDLQLNGPPNKLDGIFLLDLLVGKRTPVIIMTAWGIPRLIDAVFQNYPFVFQILDKGSFEWDKLKEYTRQGLDIQIGDWEHDLTSLESKSERIRKLIWEVLSTLDETERLHLNELAQDPRASDFSKSNVPSTDFVIITALEVEAKALLEQIDGCQIERSESQDIFTYFRGRVKISGKDKSYSIVIVRLNKMGTVAAAIGCTCAVIRWNPRFLLMVGIAGGIPQGDLDLGDVVVADQVIGHDYGKIEKNGLKRRYQVYPVSELLLNRILSFDDKKWDKKISVPRPADGKRMHSKRFVGPIASGNKVIASISFREQLLRETPKLIAVEMEAEGVFAAAAARPQIIPAIVIRGISDMADERKTDEWHEYAANAAATFVVQFLRSGPIEPSR